MPLAAPPIDSDTRSRLVVRRAEGALDALGHRDSGNFPLPRGESSQQRFAERENVISPMPCSLHPRVGIDIRREVGYTTGYTANSM